jgi:Kef-type K+ transport system membrane component KefB
MTTVALLLLASALGFAVARALRLPAVPFLVLAGLALSRIVPLPEDLVEDALVLGVTVMVFVAGIELNPARVGRQRKAALQVGGLQFLLLGMVGAGAALLLGFDLQTTAYVALALTASSTLVVIRVLQGRGQLFEPMGRMVTGVLLLQDLLVILLIPVITRLPNGAGSVGTGILATLGLVALSGAILRWVAPRVIPRLGRDEEPLLLLVLGTLFVFLGLAWFLDLPLVSGAFLAGVALSPFPSGALVRAQLNSLSDFFSAIFFTALGAFLVLPSLGELAQAVGLALVVLLLTPPLVTLVAERAGFSARSAIHGGLLLSQTSEFSLVVALQGVVLEQITPGVFSILATVTVLTMIATPFLATDPVTWALMKLHPFRRPSSPHDPPRDHVLLAGCGSNGLSLLEFLVVGPQEVWVVDDDPAVVEQLSAAGVPVIRGDVSDPTVLKAAGISEARVVISTVRRAEDNGPLLRMAGTKLAVVRTFEEKDGDWVRSHGGTPVSYSEAAADSFLAWFRESREEERESREGGREGS